MRIGTELPAMDPPDANSTVAQKAAQTNAQLSSTGDAAQESNPAAEVQKTHAIQELDLSFRKDSQGITYYVLTNPQSGEIVREIPAKEVRQVNGGIKQYLKSQAAQAAHKTDSKA